MELDKDLQSVQEMRNAVEKAAKAQEVLASFSQKQLDNIIKTVADEAFRNAEYLADLAVQETGMGVREHKVIKNQVGSRDVYESVKDEKTVGIIKEDTKNKILEYAYPYGVIAAIIPTTNPTSTAIFKTIIALKSGNAIVVSPHPSAVKCTVEALKICQRAAESAGAPEGIIGWISQPSMQATTELMQHRKIDLILATGGGGLVRAAYSSGKPAYGVGPGNVPVYLEKTCRIKQSVKMVADSKTFDNGTICATEQALVVDRNIHKVVIQEFKKHGAYFLNEKEKSKLEDVISPVRGKLNPAIVGQSAVKIAEMANVNVPANTRLLIAFEEQAGKTVPFSIEKLSPVFPFYIADSEEEAKKRCIELLNLGGRGHTMSLHTMDDEVVKSFGHAMPVSRLMVNTLSSIGAVGGTTGLKPSMTLGCGSYGGNITSDNITATHLINIKRVAYGLKEVNIPKPQKPGSSVPEASTYDPRIEEVVEKVIQSINTKEASKDDISEIVEKVLLQYQ
ncbi:aldehyde dehydrogenase family protein [Evansella clarkii]|uniref:aldehyde dehydrogenase family protein n=1 Tax=Evansella clarkii TaxID=79879 RepID=UPI000B4544AE|nr:aldehyde dehydrogenase family protein [Evansella clarkii]